MDTVQLMREAVVEALDTLPSIVALTGRANGNVVPFKTSAAAAKPIIAYLVIDARPAGGIGNTWRVNFNFSAFAADDDDATANELLRIVEETLTPPVLAGLSVPVDAYVEPVPARHDVADDVFARADLDITFIVTN